MILAVNGVMLLLVLAPIVLVVWMSFTPAAYFVLPTTQFSLRWYREALSYPGFVDAFFLSVELAAVAATLAIAASFLAAYALVRFRPPGSAALTAFFLSPLLVPAVVFGIAMLQFVNRLGLYNNLAGLVLAHAVVIAPYAMRSLDVTLRTVPEEMEWAAMVLGSSRWRTLLRVTLPLCARGMVTAFLFCFLLSFSDVTVTIFMAGPSLQTLPVRLYTYLSDRVDPTVAAVSALVVLVSLALVLAVGLLGGIRRLVAR
jgi:putative spermidine/putrescine transport system permease protein